MIKDFCAAKSIDEMIAATKKPLLNKDKTKWTANKANKERKINIRREIKKIKAEENEPREKMSTEINQTVHIFKLRFCLPPPISADFKNHVTGSHT